MEGLKASIAAGMALMQSQKTQLDYLTIRAPITGRTGSLTAKVGAMVRGAGRAAALVTINQTKPILVRFAVPQGELGALRRALAAKAMAEIEIPGGAKRTVVQGTHRLHRQPGGQDDRHDHGQGGCRERATRRCGRGCRWRSR